LLFELLKSESAKARWQAAYALAESRDRRLVAIIPALVADPEPEVRRQAGYIIVSFEDGDYRRTRSAMLTLLADAEVGVRADIAAAAAARKELASAPVLLALIEQEESRLEPWRQSNVVQAIHTLTGSYFGLTPGTPSPLAVRTEALADFAAWIREHPAER
jgi:HEAT repeat protein